MGGQCLKGISLSVHEQTIAFKVYAFNVSEGNLKLERDNQMNKSVLFSATFTKHVCKLNEWIKSTVRGYVFF